jgi:SnoaL-like domain
LFAAFNGRDWDAYFADVDPDYEWDPIGENASYRGREAVTEYLERLLSA